MPRSSALARYALTRNAKEATVFGAFATFSDQRHRTAVCQFRDMLHSARSSVVNNKNNNLCAICHRCADASTACVTVCSKAEGIVAVHCALWQVAW